MNMSAIKAVLEALRGKCYDDMADEKSDPEAKLAEAVADTSHDHEDLADEDALDHGADDAEEADSGESQDPHDALKAFFKNKKSAPPRPGTAVMIAINKKVSPVKKSMKDLMHG